jgi:peptidoglycan/xylan/chitin deacetylase (PgdA/CDA1 family)
MSVDSAEPIVALTFDDGPDLQVTPRILDALLEREVKATFFILSERAEAHPELVHRIVAEGHEVALHGVNHDNLTLLGLRQVVDRVRGGKQRLQRISGLPVRIFRPPYGAQNWRTFALTRLSGLKVVIWSADPNDWDDLDSKVIVERVLDKAKPGAIILLHDGWSPSPGRDPTPPPGDKAQTIRMILDGLRNAGLQSTTVSNLLRSGPARIKIWVDAG